MLAAWPLGTEPVSELGLVALAVAVAVADAEAVDGEAAGVSRVLYGVDPEAAGDAVEGGGGYALV